MGPDIDVEADLKAKDDDGLYWSTLAAATLARTMALDANCGGSRLSATHRGRAAKCTWSIHRLLRRDRRQARRWWSSRLGRTVTGPMTWW